MSIKGFSGISLTSECPLKCFIFVYPFSSFLSKMYCQINKDRFCKTIAADAFIDT